ncbi:hypothetical protein LSH36_1134g01008 [Paralvinella palmiformis]|uniref:Uncharacterized protein n=1 Tax=Paralvinella palmiformis TaxID=53620 RepID=A0AAD9MSC5_9ANNE|nr:hypothetical protein LSH36_1134g01008 [Paralvinella palmiformis]
METERPFDTYETTNSTYGLTWQQGSTFQKSFSQSTPYRSLTNARRIRPDQLPKDRQSIALVHDPEHPCGIMSMSNVPKNLRGEFTNVSRDYESDRQGLWANGNFNTPGATIDRGVGTYSNLQGAWARVGPSTYDSMHGSGDWVHRWGTSSYEPATLRSLYDHRNVDPRDNWVPIENVPQNM